MNSIINGYLGIFVKQGEAGPNTAELLVLDEGGNVIAQEYWALATGVKATIIVVKE